MLRSRKNISYFCRKWNHNLSVVRAAALLLYRLHNTRGWETGIKKTHKIILKKITPVHYYAPHHEDIWWRNNSTHFVLHALSALPRVKGNAVLTV